MIRQVFSVDDYWKVIVYWNMDYDFFSNATLELRELGLTGTAIEDVYETLRSRKAKAVTCSRIEKHTSVVIFNSHSSEADYINSIVHEAEHIKQAMLKAYHVEDKGEAPAYTIGYLVMIMYNAFRRFI